MSDGKKPTKKEDGRPAGVKTVERIRRLVLILAIVCLIGSAFFGKIPRFGAIGALLLYLGLTYLLDRLEKKGGEKK